MELRPRRRGQTQGVSGEESEEEFYAQSSSESGPASSDNEGEAEEVNEVEEPAAPFPPLVPVRNDNRRRRGSGMKRKTDEKLLKWQMWEAENKRWIDEHLSEDLDLDQQNEAIVETADPPPDISMPLLRYQREWLAWALEQENSVGGGILADEMGMGKTIQAISLVLARREIDKARRGKALDSSDVSCTLVLCPVSAVSQWQNEIDRFTAAGSTKVFVYHGPKREKTIKQFRNYDFVISTYSIVENEYRKFMAPPKEQCKYCGKSFNPARLVTHQKYICGPIAVKTEKQSKQKRKNSLTGKNKAGVDEHNKRKETRKETKQTEEEDALPTLAGDKSPLHSIKWNRIILDEAHNIKRRSGSTAKAIFALESSYRWALSGTPLQNHIGELYSLIRFLRIDPYSYYFCKKCDCQALEGTSYCCPDCGHYGHFCWWNKFVAKPISLYGNSGEGKRAMILLQHKILKGILLRRTKKGRAADVALPPRIISLRRDALDVKEADFYESLYKDSQAQFDTYVQAGTLTNNYAHIFDLLTRLRQAANHPYLVVYSSSSTGNVTLADDDKNGQECGLCHDPVEDEVVTSCSHIFCKTCLIDFSASLGKFSCPTCSNLITVDWTTKAERGGQKRRTTIKGFRASSILNRIKLDDFRTSTKIEALREEIRLMVKRDGSAKAIVFSQFTSFLDLINYSLGKSGINCIQLVGSMSLAARDAAIKKFTEDIDSRIFLMSLKAGGVALNLTIASHVFIMDPWWNPAMERQAQDRIHRIGQFKPIKIVRFVMENTVEERILQLQKKKDLVFEGTVGGSAAAIGKLTESDMRLLFATFK